MIRSYLKTAWRNFYKHTFYTLINVFGLSMGICCGIVLFLFISYHLSFDNYHNNQQRIYRIVNDLHIPDGSVDYDQGSPLILGQTLKQQNSAVVKEGIFLKKRSFTVSVKQSEHAQPNTFYENETVAFANNDLFKIFSYQWISGNANTALTQPNTAVITTSLAKKYFNTADAAGKIIRLDDKCNITVTGVLADNHKNSDIQAEMYISLPSVKLIYPDLEKQLFNDWEFISSKNNVFVLLGDERSHNIINHNIHTILKKALGAESPIYQFHLQPLAEIHFDGRYSGTISKPLLTILALIGLALLLIAGVNFVNMATAQSMTRAKEIGTRKVLGSSRSGIFWQFIIETAYTAVTAAIFALLATLLFLPVLNNWLQLSLSINWTTLQFLLILVVVLTFAAGFYPAVILSRFKPVSALKNVADQSRFSSRLSRSLLIITQNTIAQLLIVCALIITMQVKYLKSANMGFNKDAIIMVPIQNNDINGLTYLRNQLNNLAGVKSVSFCYSAPAAVTNKGGSIRYDGKDWEKFTENSIIGDENYLKTFGLRLLAGRNISTLSTAAEYLVNERTLVKLGIKTPELAIGHRLVAGDFNNTAGTIVGVVKDFNTRPLFTTIEPTLIAANVDYYRFAAIKIAGDKQAGIIGSIGQTWQKVYPKNVFDYHFLDQQIADFYQKEEMINKLIKAGTVVAILISCLGLIGLVSLITVQRTKEIGIRKVLGASVHSIVTLLASDFIKLITVAIVISIPLSYWAMHNWLQNFAFRIEIKWWLFALSAAVALGIAVVTISLQSIKAALANPVDSIKNN
ncbi:MAG TPA: FtsX-like permease family protein [Mucilaginibacter sp.]|jgi:putative ABC transport system permease protein